MLLIEKMAIGANDTTGTLHDKMAKLGGDMIVEALRRLEQGALPATPQPEQGVTYAAKISKEEAVLDFSLPAGILERKIRAFNPFPAACAVFAGVTLKLWQAQVLPGDGEHAAGTIISADPQDGVIVACGSGALRITELQKPGGKRLPAAEFLKAFPMQGGKFN
jgi:methionyl-tRNA formyltransferase